MKEDIINFFKSKINIALLTIQIIALVLFCVYTQLTVLLAILLESAFCILFGVKILKKNKNLTDNKEMLVDMPYSKDQIVQVGKNIDKSIKANKRSAIMWIGMGIVMFFASFSFFM